MKIPNDLTPYEALIGVSSRIRMTPEDSLLGLNTYEIPDKIFERIKKEVQDLFNIINEEKTHT